MAEPGVALREGRRAYDAADWQAAREHLEAARERAPLDADDVARLARASWWLGDVPDAVRCSEDAFRALQATGRDVDAATTALQLSLLWFTRGDLTVGEAWLGRARRILTEVEECRAHGYLLYLETSMAFVDDGEAWADAAVARITALAERFPDPVLRSLSLVVTGMSHLRRGGTAEGFALLDEAMLSVLAGELPGEWAGDVYCTTIHLCHGLADFRRMEDWTAATERWCRQFGSDAIYTGVCRIHRLELLSARGAWADVEEHLDRESTTLRSGSLWIAGGGFYQLGEIRRLRGDVEGARAAYASAREAYIDPQPGEALLALHENDLERAWDGIARALDHADRLNRVRLLRAAVEIALATGRRAEAAAFSSELSASAERYGSAGFSAWAAHARGMLAVADADTAAAVRELRAAVAAYRRERLPHDCAHALAWLGRACERAGEHDSAARERSESDAILERLGAERPIPTRLPAEQAPSLGPLTTREAEVLACIAEGASNREAAQRLFISEKTVGRHLANIYLKLDVVSRTAAAAWWHGARHNARHDARDDARHDARHDGSARR
ncbi:LuxR C-terminal-related transcriptional regulator [Microbacterium sp. LRZ72]|uniref:LuxR C-terminal-related transcriptional regulator n=1 Tax=Microbacterium sp. LRZ72 TaxID=2942481 RepID=UPI00299FA7EA|nr:LuxR C-terminal-related transcriptional regulator [Microbacterium sp. LRZ72]MDX2376913.1 LuxR C-terminal-related transcriptional regulator [Microbacterium sp. LRZ72]